MRILLAWFVLWIGVCECSINGAMCLRLLICYVNVRISCCLGTVLFACAKGKGTDRSIPQMILREDFVLMSRALAWSIQFPIDTEMWLRL